jgi:hypothetical protein
MTEHKFRVSEQASQGLFLRSKPVVSDATKIAVMPVGTEFLTTDGVPANGWYFGHCQLSGSEINGFASAKFLTPDEDYMPPKPSGLAVNLDPGRLLVRRVNQQFLAYRLNESDMPLRGQDDSASERAAALGRIIRYLSVDKYPRYHPGVKNTYCNIYATDYSYLAGTYVPRVWWTADAYLKAKHGLNPQVIYGKTVMELNANALLDWFKGHGEEFGWVRKFDLTQLQNYANEGRVVIISAAQKQPNRSGHICAIVPENPTVQGCTLWGKGGASVTIASWAHEQAILDPDKLVVE